MNARHIIIVFGVSGVGKTTACRDFVSCHRGFVQISASKLLSDAKAQGRLQLRSERSDVVLENQEVLVTEFEKFRAQIPDYSILMDAHAIINNGVSIINIPTSIIEGLRPTSLVLLEADPEEIQRRRSAREGIPLPSIKQVMLELQEEKITVKQYADSLNLPLAIGDMSQHGCLDELIDTLLGSPT